MPIVYQPGLSALDVSRLESQLRLRLPGDYKAFLSQANGLYLAAPDFSELALASVPGAVISFDRLFGVLPGEEYHDLASFNDEFIGELDCLRAVTAIGEDGGGNPYVLVQDAGREGVYYWDRTQLHQAAAGNAHDMAEQRLFCVAPNFQAFHGLIMESLADSAEWLLET